MIKYAVGYFYNNGFDEYGREDIRCRFVVGLDKSEAAKLPSHRSIFKRMRRLKELLRAE